MVGRSMFPEGPLAGVPLQALLALVRLGMSTCWSIVWVKIAWVWRSHERLIVWQTFIILKQRSTGKLCARIIWVQIKRPFFMTSKLVSLSHTVLIRIDRITMIAINMSSERTKCWEKNLAMFAIGPALVNRFVVWEGISAREPLKAVLALVYLTFTLDSVWALIVFSFKTFNQFIQLVNLYYCWHHVLLSTFCPCLKKDDEIRIRHYMSET